MEVGLGGGRLVGGGRKVGQAGHLQSRIPRSVAIRSGTCTRYLPVHVLPLAAVNLAFL